MNQESNQTNPQPDQNYDSIHKVVWMIAAFVPSVIGIACLQIKNPGNGLFPILVMLNLALSVAASIGLVRGMKNTGSKILLGLFLSAFFFVLNVVIVVFVGCSGAGRIAP